MASAQKKDVKELTRLDTKRAERGVWLVKVPGFVKDAWDRTVEGELEEDGASGPVIGNVFLAFDPCNQATYVPEAKLRLSTAEATAIPKDYEFTFQADFAPMHIFSQDPHVQGRTQAAVEGKVDYKIVVQPAAVDDEKYLGLSRTRMKAANNKLRTVSMMSTEDSRRRSAVPLPVASSYRDRFGRGARKPQQDRKMRMEKAALQDLIFKHFDRQSYWSFKELVAECDQPAAYLKEVLGEICKFNKRGPNMDKWEVKPEYRHSKPKPEGASAGDAASPEPEPAAKRMKTG